MRNFKTGLIVILLLTVGLTKVCYAQFSDSYTPPLSVKKMWHTHEWFKYSVKYGFFHLGTITVEFGKDTLYDGHVYRLARAIAKANPGIPFVGKKEDRFSSLMARNDTMCYDVHYWKDDIDEHIMKKEVYDLDYAKGKVYTYIKGVPKDTLSLTKPSMCGIAYLFFTRLYAGTNTKEKVPVYVDLKKKSITLDSPEKKEIIDNELFSNGKVETFESNGDADFDGPFGFNGHYRAWYTTGPMRIMVQAYVKVWLGNVKVRLVKYNISGQ